MVPNWKLMRDQSPLSYEIDLITFWWMKVAQNPLWNPFLLILGLKTHHVPSSMSWERVFHPFSCPSMKIIFLYHLKIFLQRSLIRWMWVASLEWRILIGNGQFLIIAQRPLYLISMENPLSHKKYFAYCSFRSLFKQP